MALVFPLMCAAGGAVLLTHQHAISNVKENLLVELTTFPWECLRYSPDGRVGSSSAAARESQDPILGVAGVLRSYRRRVAELSRDVVLVFGPDGAAAGAHQRPASQNLFPLRKNS